MNETNTPSSLTQTKTQSVTNTKMAVATAFLGIAALAAAAVGTTSVKPCAADPLADPTVVEVYASAENPTKIALCKGERVLVLTEGKNVDPDFGVRGYTDSSFILQKLGSDYTGPSQVTFALNKETDFELAVPGIEYTGLYRGMNKKTGQAVFYVRAKETAPTVAGYIDVSSLEGVNTELTKGKKKLAIFTFTPVNFTESICLNNLNIYLQKYPVGGVSLGDSIALLNKSENVLVQSAYSNEGPSNVVFNVSDEPVCIEPNNTELLVVDATVLSAAPSSTIQAVMMGYTFVGASSGQVYQNLTGPVSGPVWYGCVDGACLSATTTPGATTTVDFAISSCDVDITEPGSYYLTNDLTSCMSGRAIDIDSDNVVLSCNGYSVDGSSSSVIGKKGIAIEGNNVTVTHCNVSNFDQGIVIFGENASVSYSTIYDNDAAGLQIANKGKHSIYKNTITNNDKGIWLTFGMNYQTQIFDSNVCENKTYDIDCDYNATGITGSDNTFGVVKSCKDGWPKVENYTSC